MKYALYFAALLSLFALAAAPRDVQHTFDLLKKGSSITTEEAAKLEDRLTTNAHDEDARIRLLAFYVNPPAGANIAAIKAARARHIFWLIENDPKEGIGLFQVATGVYNIHCQGDPLADPESFKHSAELWLEQLKKNPTDADIRRKAIDAIQFCTPEGAEGILIDNNDNGGLGRLYALTVLGVTGTSYVNSDSAGSDPALRSSTFAAKARQALDQAKDKDLITWGAITLLREGANMLADGTLDWDYTALGDSLLVKARKLSPDNITLMAVPVTLPARGERPPAIIRVGGNVQGASLIRKIRPVYPDAAKRQRIHGVVQLTALIGPDGTIQYLRPDAGPIELVPVTMEAVRQWQYKPTLLNGRPCYVVTRIDVDFSIR